MAEVLVTGGAGRLGANLSYALHERGHVVRVMDIPDAPFDIFEGEDRYRIIKGDVGDAALVNDAATGTSIVYHLAGLLPPVSEEDREGTFDINVGGTGNVIDACKIAGVGHLVFTSSVSVYGDTSGETPPVRVEHPLRALNIYPETKIEAEKLIIRSDLPYTICRIAGVAVPAFLDPPEPWPFTPEQRVEFIALGDVVTALVNLLGNEEIRNRIVNLAGGPSWQMMGTEYVKRFCETMELSLEKQTWYNKPGWLDWYDTEESQKIMRYQSTSFDGFHELLRKAVEEALS